MRLKTFHAKSLKDAMALVREQLGDDAIIVATHDSDGPQGARVTAAVEQEDQPYAVPGDEAQDIPNLLTDALERHGAPPDLTDRLVNEAAMIEAESAIDALAHALAAVFRFEPLPDSGEAPPLLLIGPPGVGKTISGAKLAARAFLNDNAAPAALIAADSTRLGAVEQLRLYADRLGARFFTAQDAQTLAAALAQCRKSDLAVIDTAGVNPFKLEELAALVELSKSAPMEPVLVLTAGRDAEEAADLAKAFRPVEPRRLLITGYDIARRLGSMLAAAEASGLALSGLGASPVIGDGFEPLDARKLAALLLPNQPNPAPPPQRGSSAHMTEPKPNHPPRQTAG
ncbi:MAG: GTPase [Alphaproteobacteria bacterium]|nr:GTPase [Alphaproteobacteria bacterium]